MTDRLKIALAQMNQRVGDLDGNARRCSDAAQGGGGRGGPAGLPRAAAGRLSARGSGAEARVRRGRRCTDDWSTRRSSRRPASADRHHSPTSAGRISTPCCWPKAARSSAAPSSMSCPTTAPSTRSASSPPARCPNRSNGGGSSSACPSARTCGWSRSARISRSLAPSCSSCPTAAPTSSTRTRRASGWRGRGHQHRPAARVPQPRRRAGRAGVRRLVLHHAPRRRDRRPDGRLGRGFPDHRLGADAPTAGAARRVSEHELDSFPADVYRAMMVALRDYVGRNGFTA